MIEGMPQEAQYGKTHQRIYYVTRVGTAETAPDSAPTIAIKDPLGTQITSGTMTIIGTTKEYYFEIDCSNSAYRLGSNYCAEVSCAFSLAAQTDLVWFDVVRYPFNSPMVTADEINRQHPGWAASHPSGSSGTWKEPIERAHAELARRLRSTGKRPSMFINKDELYPYELAFAKAEIARLCGFPNDELTRWEQRAEDLWASKGEFQFDSTDDGVFTTEDDALNAGETTVIRHVWTR